MPCISLCVLRCCIFNASLSSWVVLIFSSMLGRLTALFKTHNLNGSERSVESKLLLSQGQNKVVNYLFWIIRPTLEYATIWFLLNVTVPVTFCLFCSVLFRAMNCLLIDWLRCFMASEGESNVKTMKILMKLRFYRVTSDIVHGISKLINNS